MPNDNYVVNESTQRTTRTSWPTTSRSRCSCSTTPDKWGADAGVELAELAKILDGTSDLDLFEPLDTGVWITIDADTVRADLPAVRAMILRR